MILFSLGPYGPFAGWWDAAVMRLAEIGLGQPAAIHAESPEDISGGLLRCTTPHHVIVSRRPSSALRALLTESGAPLLIGVDDPREGLFQLVNQGHAFRAATQILADSCGAAMICGGMSRALVVNAHAVRHRTAEALGGVAQFCGLDIPLEDIGIAAPPGPSAAAQDWWAALDPDERSIPEGALRGYETWLTGHGVGDMVWDRRLFVSMAGQGGDAGAAIDIGDAPRVLLDGPGIGLPPGRWAASITLAVSREVNGARFDIAIQPGLAQGSVICDGRGLGSATLLFTVEPAWGQTVSVTVASTAPAPGGRLALGNVVLAPGLSDGSGIPVELSSALSL